MRALFATGLEEVATRPVALEDAIRLAARHGTVCDAAYLGLAIDVDGELATLDNDLLRAAEAEGVSVAGRAESDLAAERWAAAADDPEIGREPR